MWSLRVVVERGDSIESFWNCLSTRGFFIKWSKALWTELLEGLRFLQGELINMGLITECV